MSVNYSLALMSSKPGDNDAKKMYYAKAQASGEVTMDEMAEDIAYSTSLTDGDVLNALRALIKQVNKHLAGCALFIIGFLRGFFICRILYPRTYP